MLEQAVRVLVLDVDVVTWAYLETFLAHHGHPDVVVVSPGDFARLTMIVSREMVQNDIIWLLGTRWKRASGAITELSWQFHELRSKERR